MEIKIEKNIPIPVTEIKYPFDKMDVGDSFFIAEHQIKALSNSLGFSIWKIEKANIELLKAANSFYENVLKMFRRRPDR